MKKYGKQFKLYSKCNATNPSSGLIVKDSAHSSSEYIDDVFPDSRLNKRISVESSFIQPNNCWFQSIINSVTKLSLGFFIVVINIHV